MEVDGRGHVVRYELHDGVINSAARMTYGEVDAILTARETDVRARYATLVPTFELMHDVFLVLNARRRARGSIDFDLPEPEVLLDADGLVADIVASSRNVAHRIIEEFMLLANETVAAHLEAHAWPAVYRVHERPDPVKVAQFEQFVATLGYALGASPETVTPRHFQRLVDRIAGTPAERPIAFLMLQAMQKARYDVADLGHFGLAASSYTHFTSPIRRYPDLLVHRALREQRAAGELDQDARAERLDDLADCARLSSDAERRADEAERELLQWKKVRFMADKVGERFAGYVTGVVPFGLFVELAEHFVEGLVHVSSMSDDYYHFLDRARVLEGEQTHRRYRLGDRVTVQVARVDVERRQIDLVLTDVLERGRRQSGSTGRARAREGGGTERRRASRPGKRERVAMKTKGRKG
jgi:ribonuclease R